MQFEKLRIVASYWLGEEGGLRAVMARGVSGLASLRLLYVGLRYLIAIIIARLVGAEGFGIYAFANSWMTLAAVVGTCGLNTVTEREVADARTRKKWAAVSGVLLFTIAIVVVLGGVIGFASFGLSYLVIPDSNDILRQGLWIALLGLPFLLIMRQLNAVQNGFLKVVQGSMSTMLVNPLVFLISLTAVALWFEQVSVLTVMACYLVSVIGACLAAIWLTSLTLRRYGHWAQPRFEPKRWMRSGGFLSLMGVMHLLNMNVDILMLGSLKGQAAAGVYGAATRGAELTTMALVVLEGPLRPMLGSLMAEANIDRVKRIVTKTARAALIGGVTLAVLLLVVSDWYLLLFGEEFVAAKLSLVILIAAHLFYVATGPVVPLLIMSGNESAAAKCVVLSVVLNVTLNAVLIPRYGIEGAAVATACSVILWNALMYRVVRIKLGVDSTAFGRHAVGTVS